MIMTLLWLTVSTPFVFHAEQQLKKIQKEIAANSPVDNAEENNPFSTTTEEKSSGGINLSEEYLHHTQTAEHPWFSIITRYRHFNTSLYIAFHGELFSPPPNA
jgi:hypothetical protein